MNDVKESFVEDAAHAWLETLGWTIVHSPDIAPALLLKLVSEEVRWWSLLGREGLYHYLEV